MALEGQFSSVRSAEARGRVLGSHSDREGWRLLQAALARSCQPSADQPLTPGPGADLPERSVIANEGSGLQEIRAFKSAEPYTPQ
jgi:hypothetical protein